jgi:hypothetical protein
MNPTNTTFQNVHSDNTKNFIDGKEDKLLKYAGSLLKIADTLKISTVMKLRLDAFCTHCFGTDRSNVIHNKAFTKEGVTKGKLYAKVKEIKTESKGNFSAKTHLPVQEWKGFEGVLSIPEKNISANVMEMLNSQNEEDAGNSDFIKTIKDKNYLYETAKSTTANDTIITREEQAQIDTICLKYMDRYAATSAEMYNTELAGLEGDQKKQTIQRQQAHVAEMLSKNHAYLAPKEGSVVKIPVLIDSNWETKDFTVQAHTLGKDIPFYTLKCEDISVPTIILFRGTELRPGYRDGSGESVAEDTKAGGVGENTIDNSWEQIKTNIIDNSNKIQIMGHSLGGAYTQHLALRMAENNIDSKLDRAWGFNTAGVSGETEKRYELVNNITKNTTIYSASLESKIDLFAVYGDQVSAAGRMAGTKHVVRPSDEVLKQKGGITIHFPMLLNQPNTGIYNVENPKRDTSIRQIEATYTRSLNKFAGAVRRAGNVPLYLNRKIHELIGR